MKKILVAGIAMFLFLGVFAQEIEEEEKKKGFNKEKLFSGGSVSLSFFNRSFLAGVNPVFGYSLANWADVGVVANFSYATYADYNVLNDRLREVIYGGGLFVKLYPVRFLFVQAQAEHNFVTWKYLPPDDGATIKDNTSANSLLVGGGYTTGRMPGTGNSHFYVALLFDVSGNDVSPYVDGLGRAIPIIRAGVQIPLFQGNRYE